MFDAVLFDMDGTLLDTERVWLHGLLEAAGDVPGAERFFDSVIGVHADEVLGMLEAWLPASRSAQEVLEGWEAAAFARMAEGAPLKPGVRELLAHIELPMAVVTSSGREHAINMLTKAGIWDALVLLVSRDDVARHKPLPDPYLAAAEQLGVAPSRCAAFEDSPTGVRSAVAAGSVVVQVPDVAQPDAELRALGHVVAPDLVAGAREIGLIG